MTVYNQGQADVRRKADLGPVTEADIYPRLGPSCEWGSVVAQAVLEGAGGVVLDLNGRSLRFGKPDVLNPSFIATCYAPLISV